MWARHVEFIGIPSIRKVDSLAMKCPPVDSYACGGLWRSPVPNNEEHHLFQKQVEVRFPRYLFRPTTQKKERVLTVDDYIIKGARTQRTTGLLSYELPLRFLNLNQRGESRNKGL